MYISCLQLVRLHLEVLRAVTKRHVGRVSDFLLALFRYTHIDITRGH